MSEKTVCRCCGQPLPPRKRGGIYLPALKADIFDFVLEHPGITAEGIHAQLFSGTGSPVSIVRVHVCQINDLLEGTDLRIRGNFAQLKGCYFIASPTATRPSSPRRSGAPASKPQRRPPRSF